MGNMIVTMDNIIQDFMTNMNLLMTIIEEKYDKYQNKNEEEEEEEDSDEEENDDCYEKRNFGLFCMRDEEQEEDHDNIVNARWNEIQCVLNSMIENQEYCILNTASESIYIEIWMHQLSSKFSRNSKTHLIDKVYNYKTENEIDLVVVKEGEYYKINLGADHDTTELST